MSFLPASRTKRNLFKIASLGLAGLLAGLLSGCTDSPDSPDTSATAPYTHVASDSFNPDVSTAAQPAPLPNSIEATQIPALRHPPSARRLQLGSVHTVSQTVARNGRSGY
jgi:hypothetical protein